jgi:hypothetical protein
VQFSVNPSELEADYATAWDEWEASGDFADWEPVADDGLVDDPS